MLPFAGVLAVAPPDWRGDDPTVADSPSEASDGICRLSFGRGPDLDPLVFDRDGAANSGGAFGCIERGSGLLIGVGLSRFTGGGSLPPKNEASTDPSWSIGVKILWDFEDIWRGRSGLPSGGRRD